VGDHVGANPVDRAKPGSKIQLVCEGRGLPLAAAVTAANLADVTMLAAVVDDIPPVCTPSGRRRCRPGKLDADKGYDSAANRAWLRRRGITARIARRGIESSQRLGRHRWRVERALSWQLTRAPHQVWKAVPCPSGGRGGRRGRTASWLPWCRAALPELTASPGGPTRPGADAAPPR
jgi:hypothetical protein